MFSVLCTVLLYHACAVLILLTNYVWNHTCCNHCSFSLNYSTSLLFIIHDFLKAERKDFPKSMYPHNIHLTQFYPFIFYFSWYNHCLYFLYLWPHYILNCFIYPNFVGLLYFKRVIVILPNSKVTKKTCEWTALDKTLDYWTWNKQSKIIPIYKLCVQIKVFDIWLLTI